MDDWFQPDIEIDGRARHLIETVIMVLWRARSPKRRGCSSTAEQLEAVSASDLRSVTDLALRSSGSAEEAEAYVEWLRRRTPLVSSAALTCWSAIEAVADALIEERVLSGHRVREIYHATLDELMAQRHALPIRQVRNQRKVP